MAFNLIDLVKDQLTDQVTGYIGNMIGGDKVQTKSALDGAIPAILGSLMQSSSTKSGAGTLFDTISKQDDSFLDDLGGMLSGNKSDSITSKGTDMLGSLLGGGKSSGGMLGSIIDSVSGSSGVSKSGTKSLMGLLTPMILSVIKKQLLGGGKSSFNVGSMIDMFTGQKDNVTAALPKGLNLDFGDNTVNKVADNVSQTTQEVAKEGKSFLSKLLPLLLLVVAAWFVYNIFFKGSETQQTTQPTQHVNNAVDLAKDVTGTLGSIMSTLNGITDVSSAQAAVTNLTAATNKLGTYASMLDKLPASAREPISKLVASALPQLKEQLSKLGAIPGVGPIIKPIVENLGSKLALFQ